MTASFRRLATSPRGLTASLGASLLLFGLAGCQGMPASEATPTSAWSQTLVTQLAGELQSRMSTLYTTALKDPEFHGEQGPFQQILNDLRVLQESSGELHQQLADGKGRAETLDTWEDIRSTARDARESAGWTQLPDDFRAKAEAAVGIVDQIEPYFGAP